jgi:hypothetical protein
MILSTGTVELKYIFVLVLAIVAVEVLSIATPKA